MNFTGHTLTKEPTMKPTLAEAAQIAAASTVCPKCGAALVTDDGTDRTFACGRWDKAPAGSLSPRRSVINLYRTCREPAPGRQVFRAKTGSQVSSENYSEPLTVTGRTYAAYWTIEDILSLELEAEEVRLSADGRSFTTDWHSGPESDQPAVYVEIRRQAGASFHGWVDAESRKIVQAG